MRITATIELASGHHINLTCEREKKKKFASAVSVNNLLALSRFRFCARHFHSFSKREKWRWSIFRAHTRQMSTTDFQAIKPWFISSIPLKMCLKHRNFVWIFVGSQTFRTIFRIFYKWHWYIDRKRETLPYVTQVEISKIFRHLTEINVQIVLLLYLIWTWFLFAWNFAAASTLCATFIYLMHSFYCECLYERFISEHFF